MNRGLPFILNSLASLQVLHGIHDIMFRLVPSLREEVRSLSADKERLSRALSARDTRMFQEDASTRDEEVEEHQREASTRVAMVERLRGEVSTLGAEEENKY